MRVSIILCTWRRPGPLQRCLEALCRLGCAPSESVEILTVHPPGNEESERMVADRFAGVRIVRAPAPNLSAQRNLGAREATGEMLAYLDDDAWPREGWLEGLAAGFREPVTAAVGGAVFDPEGVLMLGRAGPRPDTARG